MPRQAEVAVEVRPTATDGHAKRQIRLMNGSAGGTLFLAAFSILLLLNLQVVLGTANGSPLGSYRLLVKRDGP